MRTWMRAGVLGLAMMGWAAVANAAEETAKEMAAQPYVWRSVTIKANGCGKRVLIEVVDHGPGVDQAELSTIFEKFYRSPNSAATLQGTGLGLSITRGLVEAMGGSVEARRNSPENGMTVALQLPRSA